jgi:hypothetical protein
VVFVQIKVEHLLFSFGRNFRRADAAAGFAAGVRRVGDSLRNEAKVKRHLTTAPAATQKRAGDASGQLSVVSCFVPPKLE